MRAQWVKDFVHRTLGEMSLLNRYRIQLIGRGSLRSRRPDGQIWVQLGSGAHYIDGMINVDVNPFRKSDMWLDLRKGLPFADNSVDAIYCCHTLEHFYEPDVRGIIRECMRSLKPKGGLRVVTPDLKKAVEAYLQGDIKRFSDFPDRRKSIGGKLANYLLCRDQHRLIFDFSFWKEILEDEKFMEVAECKPHESRIFPTKEISIFEYEHPDAHHSVFVEAFKN
jgi:predicted SAM-dependent methyltransferase